MNMVVKCAEWECTPVECNREELSENLIRCSNCSEDDKCCCLAIHVIGNKNRCCNDSSCAEFDVPFSRLNPQIKPTNSIHSPQPKIAFGIWSFFSYAKGLYAAALGIEILCIAAAEIGDPS